MLDLCRLSWYDSKLPSWFCYVLLSLLLAFQRGFHMHRTFLPVLPLMLFQIHIILPWWNMLDMLYVYHLNSIFEEPLIFALPGDSCGSGSSCGAHS